MKFFDNFGGFRASVEAFFCELASLKSKDKKKFSKAQQLCENMLIGQDEDSKIEILSTSSENESKADDIKEEKAKAAKEELFDKIQEIKTKNFPLYSKETIQPSLRVWH